MKLSHDIKNCAVFSGSDAYVWQDTDAQAWYNRYKTANSNTDIDTVSLLGVDLATVQAGMDTFVQTLKSDGVWSTIYDGFAQMPFNVALSVVTLKGVETGTTYGSISSATVSGGLVLDGTDDYYHTTLMQSDLGATNDNCGVSFELTSITGASTGWIMGAYQNTHTSIYNSSGTMYNYWAIPDWVNTRTLAVGFWTFTRDSSANNDSYKNGIVDASTGGFGSNGFNDQAMVFGARNNNGTIEGYINISIKNMLFHTDWTEALHDAYYNAYTTLMTVCGL